MADYEAEHNLPAHSTSSQAETKRPHNRPDLSTFFSLLEASEPDPATTNPHIEPLPIQVEALQNLLADAYAQMRGGENDDEDHVELLDGLIDQLRGHSSRRIEGVSDEWLDGLERINKTKLKGKKCPICNEEFLSDPYPLVVVLPCHKDHWFDLECIKPWLKLNPTCPLDRKNFKEKKEVPKKEEDEDEDYDDYYG